MPGESRHPATCSKAYSPRCRRTCAVSASRRESDAVPRMTIIMSIRGAMDVSMERDGNVFLFGEVAGYFGGVFRCTLGLQRKYGTSRCFDTPISELGIVGAAIGMAAYGLRPCGEVQ